MKRAAITSIGQLKQATRALREQRKRIVFTSGCFDILHAGHVKYLREAKELGDFLVVGLNSDASVKQVKGMDRPMNSEADRREVLCALKPVDAVIIYPELDACRLMEEIRPDIYVKGGDYSPDSFAALKEVRLMAQLGGISRLLGWLPNRSTSALMKSIQQIP